MQELIPPHKRTVELTFEIFMCKHFRIFGLTIILLFDRISAKGNEVFYRTVFTQAACSFPFLFAQHHIDIIYYFHHNELAFLL